MKNMKKVLSVFLTLLIMLMTAFSVGAEKKTYTAAIRQIPESADEVTAAVSENSSEEKTADKSFNKEKAMKAALTAAKARFAVEKIDIDTISTAAVTKLKYNKKDSSYSVTVRAKRIHKYECRLSVKNFLGAQIGLPEDSTYEKCGKVSSFFGQGFEKISYFFIRLFNMDEP